MPKNQVVIKNVAVTPERAPNDGSGRARVLATVFTASEGAGIRDVGLDLTALRDGPPLALEFTPGEGLKDSREGVYAVEFEIGLLAEPGVYDLPVRAHDSAGSSGEAFARLVIEYRRPPYSGSILADDNQAVLGRVSGAPLLHGNTVRVLASGDEAFRARMELLRGARRRINLETYTLSGEGDCAQLLEAIAEKAAEGVEVNIILNSSSQLAVSPLTVLKLGLVKAGQDLSKLVREVEEARESGKELGEIIQGLRQGQGRRGIRLILAGGEAILGAEEEGGAKKRSSQWLEKMARDQKDLDRERKKRPSEAPFFRGPAGLPSLPLLSFAVHEKILVVDGLAAVVGGRNLEDRYFRNWIDLDFMLSGPAARAADDGFIRTWNEFATNLQRGSDAIAPGAGPAGPEPGGQAVRFVQSRPWAGDYRALDFLVTALQMARSHVLITSQYIVLPDCLLRDAILDAARRGVAVSILTNSRATISDMGIAAGYYISLNYFETLMEAGVRLYEMRGPEREGGEVTYLHAKEFLIDGEWAAVGSFNLSIRSCYIESENLVACRDPALVRGREEAFWSLVQNRAIPITPGHVAAQKERFSTQAAMARYLELLY